MGSCCSNSTSQGSFRQPEVMIGTPALSLNQLALLIKIQARVRGFLGRKKVKEVREVKMGMQNKITKGGD